MKSNKHAGQFKLRGKKVIVLSCKCCTVENWKHECMEKEMDKEIETFTPCACMGKIANDPYCPCEMKAKGLTPTNLWTEEKKQELNDALSKVFGWENK